MNDFDPNGVGVNNGNIFGLPYNYEEADIIIIPVKWDLTASYRKGTSLGPDSILRASTQLDYYFDGVEKPWELKVFIESIPQIFQINKLLRTESEEYINFLETGGNIRQNSRMVKILETINQASQDINMLIHNKVEEILSNNKVPVILGGEHSSPYSLIKRLAEKENFGILQIDAHADLRNSYEGFKYSHASIFWNIISSTDVSLTQVGLRDLCIDEIEFQRKESKISTFTNQYISKCLFNAKSWDTICEEIIETLPNKVYISFDIDGLSPDNCPNTGTPVPGGLTFDQATYLISKIVKSNKEIISFDLCEVAPGKHNDWDANVGARILWNLLINCGLSKNLIE